MALEGYLYEELSEDAKRGLGSLFFFLVHYIGLDLDEQPHREMCDAIESCEKNDACPNGMMTVPRGTYKTTIIMGAMIWKQLRRVFIDRNPYHSILFGSVTLSLGERMMRVIEATLVGQGKEGRLADYGQLWVPLTRGKAWSRVEKGSGIDFAPRVFAGEMASRPDPNIWITSARRTSTGHHCNEEVWDDLHSDEEMQTEHQREKAKKYARLMLPMLDPVDKLTGRSGRVWLNATRWHDDDVPGMILDLIDKGAIGAHLARERWRLVQHGAFTDVGATEGPLYFPAVLTREVLAEREEIMGPALFSANYLNDPVGKRGGIDESQIVFMPRDKFPPLSHIRATWDPNQHSRAMALGCWCAGMVSGYDRFANLYFLDAIGGREWDSDDFLRGLFEFDDGYEGIPQLIEDEHMAHFAALIDREQQLRALAAEKEGKDRPPNLHVRWIPVPRDRTYEQRWLRLRPRFMRGQIFFAEEIAPDIKHEIRSELVRWTASKYSDFLDAMAMAEEGVRPKVNAQGQRVEQPVGKVAGSDNPLSTMHTFAEMLPPEMLRKMVTDGKEN